MQNLCADCPQANALVTGPTGSSAFSITADMWAAQYVEVAYEPTDAARWSLPTSSLTLMSTGAASSSRMIVSATPSSSIAEIENNQSHLSTGAKAGIASAAVITVIAVVTRCLLLYRRRAKVQETPPPVINNLYTKAELFGEPKPHVELHATTGFHEAGSLGKVPAVDNSNTRAELESDWTGWEAPAPLQEEAGQRRNG
jgi:hypothetical protein